MKKNSPVFQKLLRIVFLLFGICCTFFSAYSQEDFNIQGVHTIAKENIEEYRNVTLTGNNSVLNVNGTLVVQGNLTMDGNFSQFNMGSDARVIIFGNFTTKNQISIEVSSFLIIHGNFIKGGSENKGELDVDNGNIYIYGSVDNWGNQFTTCPEYTGGTGAIEKENCDYGTEDELENNPNLPEDLLELNNCYDLSTVSVTKTCLNGSATFTVDNLALQDVIYEWQERINDNWTVFGTTSTVTITNVVDFEKVYRLVVRSNGDASCRISISKTLKVELISEGLIWTGTTDTNWNNPLNWSCNAVPTLETDVVIPADVSRFPVISAGANALAKDLTIEVGASIEVTDNWLRIAGKLTNSGKIEAAAGSISFEGSSSQIIPANSFEHNRIRNLNISNTEGVSSQGNIEILNSLKVEKGIFETGDALVLVSDATGTAFIDGSGNGEILGKVTMQRYLSNAYGYKYFSSPLKNTSVAHLAANFDLIDPVTEFPHLYEYVEGRKDSLGNDLSGWQKFLDPAAILQPAAGYAINPVGEVHPLTLSLSGEVNDDTISIAVENNKGTYTNGFNLVGNPYPSPIDWDKIALDGIDGAIHFFTSDAEDRYTGVYNTYLNGVSTRGTASNIIPSMQGFFVRVSDPIDGNYPAKANLTFTNAARTGNELKQEYYKSKNKPEVPKMRFSASFKDTGVSDVMLLYFPDGATSGFESHLDAQKLMNTAVNVPNFYSLGPKGEKLAINAVPRVSSERFEIPLGISAERSGEIVLTLAEVNNMFSAQHIYLKDKRKGGLQNLNQAPEYHFSIQKGENNDRFSLILTSEKISENELSSPLEYFSVHASNGEILVKLNLPENTSGNVVLSNVSGQVIQKKKGEAKEELRFSGVTVPAVYLVSLEFENERFTKKVLIKK